MRRSTVQFAARPLVGRAPLGASETARCTPALQPAAAARCGGGGRRRWRVLMHRNENNPQMRSRRLRANLCANGDNEQTRWCGGRGGASANAIGHADWINSVAILICIRVP